MRLLSGQPNKPPSAKNALALISFKHTLLLNKAVQAMQIKTAKDYLRSQTLFKNMGKEMINLRSWAFWVLQGL